MPKIKCNCGEIAEVLESKKHKALSYRCPVCGPINGRAKGRQEWIRKNQFDDSVVTGAGESVGASDSGAGQESDSGGQTGGRKSIFSGWGTVL